MQTQKRNGQLNASGIMQTRKRNGQLNAKAMKQTQQRKRPKNASGIVTKNLIPPATLYPRIKFGKVPDCKNLSHPAFFIPPKVPFFFQLSTKQATCGQKHFIDLAKAPMEALSEDKNTSAGK